MDEENVKQKFLMGIEMFEQGLPQPIEREKRIESLGWRHAKKAKTDFELALESVIEAYCEKNYQAPFI